VIYYEHAQHQHHYEHEEEPGWGPPWSRSIEPEEAEADLEDNINTPYRAHQKKAVVYPTRPLLTLS
ncbi:jg19307, partial [Pararge aegeria aegeria]